MPNTPESWLAEFITNTVTAGIQNRPDVIQLNNGNILVSWESDEDVGAGSVGGIDMIGRIFDPFGNAVTGEFRLNNFGLSDDQEDGTITALDDGGFMVVYEDNAADNNLLYTTFNAAGAFQNTGFIINDSTTSILPNTPVIKSLSATSVLIVYEIDSGSGDVDVRGKIYNPNTDTVGSEFNIFNNPAGLGEDIGGFAVTTLTSGEYAVVISDVDSSSDSDIFVNRYDSGGTLLGQSTVASDGIENYDPEITALSGGGFVVSWTLDGTGGTNSGIRARVYDNSGTAVTSALNPVTTVAGNQNESIVIGLEDGSFVVAWDNDGTGPGLAMQHYNAAGAKLGTEFVFESGGGASQLQGTSLQDGRFAITWETGNNIKTEIFDTRDLAEEQDDGTTIGTIGDDVIVENQNGNNGDIFAWDGNDTITITSAGPPSGFETFDGGNGTDLLNFNGSLGVNINLQTGIIDYASQNDDVVVNIENVTGTMGNDTITGDNGANVLSGNDGNDTILGNGGADTLNGGDGDDVMIGGTGTDTFNGGGGVDMIDYSGNTADGTVDMTGGTAIFGAVTETFSSVENVTTGSGDDLIIINSNAAVTGHTFDGGTGNDTIEVTTEAIGNRTINLSTGEYIDNVGDIDDILNFENAIGGLGADTIIGTTAVNVINGGGGNDFIDGAGGNDILDGEGGDDTVLYSLGASSLGAEYYGGTGTDTFSTNNVSNFAGGVVFDMSANEMLFNGSQYAIWDSFENFDGASTGGDFNVIGDSGVNTITVGSGNNAIDGGDGDDTLNAGLGDDTLYQAGDGNANVLNGEGGTDTWSVSALGGGFSNSNWTININSSVNTASNGTTVTTNSIENVISGVGNDSLQGSNVANVLSGNNGNDSLAGGGGADTLNGDDGNDTITGGSGNDLINGGDGDDFITGGTGVDTMNGGNGTDTLNYAGATVAIEADMQAGISTIVGGQEFFSSIEIFISGNGDDNIFGSTTADTIFGECGNDDLRAGDGDDILNGGSGDDVMYGQNDDDTLNGGNNNDTLLGGLGNDTVNGDAGNDFINGQAGDDILNGGDGVDDIFGASGNDTIDAGIGNDDVNAGGGDDNIDGGEGNDDLRGAVGFDSINGGNGDDIVSGGNQNDTINGDAGDDILNGDAGNDIVNGGDDNDTLIGASGQDVLSGDAGNDNLSGDAGGDDLFGGAGDDILDGGGDNDDLNGGAGADIFVANLGFRTDRIQDFEDGIDLIDFSGNVLANDIGDVLAAATQVGANVRIDLNANNALIIENFDLADLDASDFIF